MTLPVKIALAGALGRMGLALEAALLDRPDLVIVGKFDRPGATGPGLTTAEEALVMADVVIDFTTAEASTQLAEGLAARGGPAMVIGATGFTEAQAGRIAAAARSLPIVRTGNYSLGVNLLAGLVARASRALSPEAYDIEVFEAHHKRKVDAPSGTALLLGQAAADGRGQVLSEVSVRARDGMTGPRRAGDIGFSVLRGGGIVGDHSVIFAAEDEIITLSHSARDRSLFARGAVEAARWVAGKEPGEYDMQDVLGLKT
ncbi:MAG: 4-hydroxy-tetrahydrodipicolinate reductase [Alphaproteobacteria bacterium PA2]|nr:MAG: 4-hydroxy-tetrahydrodipicolinate reductase [Alphaproteobacteria bacterium PA2]